jgi:thioredoxin 1
MFAATPRKFAVALLKQIFHIIGGRMLVTQLTADNFEKEVLESKKPAIVDFFAEWCGPCRMMAPIFEELSKEYKGKLGFFKVNVDQFPKVTDLFEVHGIPCFIIINDKKEAARIVGYNPKEKMQLKIDEILAKVNTK